MSHPAPAPNAADLAPAHPDRWIAVLRVVVGLWFLKSVVTKLEPSLAGGFFPFLEPTDRWVGFMPGRVAEFAEGNPAGFYAAFLREVVVPNGPTFAALAAYGEAVVGLGLTLGVLTRYAAAVGLWMSLNYFLSTFWMSSGQMGFHLLLAACMVAFIGAGAGRTWGVDGRLARGRLARGERSGALAGDAVGVPGRALPWWVGA